MDTFQMNPGMNMMPNPAFPFPMMSQLGQPTPLLNQVTKKNDSTENTLYVGNVHPSMNDESLFDIFRQYGEITSCKIMKDHFTQKSRGFAFVTYENKESAQKALEELNFKLIEGRELRIYFKKSTRDFNPDANIFFKNLSKNILAKDLSQICKQYGEILSCIIKENSQGESLGYGYVQFKNVEDANKAIQELNDKEIQGQIVKVEKYQKNKNSNQQIEKKNIYIKNFPPSWNRKQVENFLKENIESIGNIQSHGIFDKEIDNINKYFAFYAFENSKDAKQAINEFHNKKLFDNDLDNLNDEEKEGLYVQFAQTKKERREQFLKESYKTSKSTNLHFKGIRSGITEDNIKQVFSKYGTITSLCLKQSEYDAKYTDDKLQFCFINFSKPKEAKDAFLGHKGDKEILDFLHPNHNTNIEFLVYAQPKHIRESYLKMKKNFKKFSFFQNANTSALNTPLFGQLPMPGMPIIQPNQPMMGPTTMMPPQIPEQNLDMQRETIWTVERLTQDQEEFAKLEEEKRRNILGELMYPKVLQKCNDQGKVSKITGMLIDLDILELEEIIDILNNDESLEERINEALEVIDESED